MANTGWVITLDFTPDEAREPRMAAIVKHIDSSSTGRWLIADIEAVGEIGQRWTQSINTAQTLSVTSQDLVDMLNGGQIVELAAAYPAAGPPRSRLVVRDGISVDVYGTGAFIPNRVLGQHHYQDLSEFDWG